MLKIFVPLLFLISLSIIVVVASSPTPNQSGMIKQRIRKRDDGDEPIGFSSEGGDPQTKDPKHYMLMLEFKPDPKTIQSAEKKEKTHKNNKKRDDNGPQKRKDRKKYMLLMEEFKGPKSAGIQKRDDGGKKDKDPKHYSLMMGIGGNGKK